MTLTRSPLNRAAATVAGLALAAGLTTAVAAPVASGAEGVALSAAAAKPARTAPTIRLTPNRRLLTGIVRSARPACRVDRQLALVWDKPGRRGPRVVAAPQSNRRGVWRQAEQGTIPRGRYVVKALAKQNCRPGKSRILTVR